VDARLKVLLCVLLLPCAAAAFDHDHEAWDALLKKHVVLLDGGKASRLQYAAIAQERAALQGYLQSLSRVSEAEFKTWSRHEQMAFLINAYNAHAVEKVLTRYPNLKSIWDFGRFFANPFRDSFFSLFGAKMTLDTVEHEILRKEGVYDEPRVHVAVVCASIGCPMLRNEAFTPEKLDAQLEDAMRRFMSDRTRNRYNAQAKRLEISKIFDWYGKDFEKGHKGHSSVKGTMAKYADLLADAPADRKAARSQSADVTFLDYDWALNDIGVGPR